MKLRNALVAAGLMALPATAFAQPVDGFYIGAGGGYTYSQDQDVKSAGGFSSPDKLTTNGGVVGSVSAGYGFGNGLRLELQGDYRNFHQGLSGPGAAGSGSVLNQTYGGFVNGLFDFDVGAGVAFPYAGLGVGYEWTDISNSAINATSSSVAAQAILGVSFPIPEVAGLSATAEYRFMTPFEDEKFRDSGVDVKLGPQYNHSVLVGLRYAFGVAPMEMAAAPPAPAPAVAPAPAPARTYLVFFDWDKYDLSARARQIIAEAAQNATKVQVTKIEVSGNADLSGTHAYNMGLSQRRADAVAAELVRLGIPKAEIAIFAYGDTRPLVPTAPGVREPQNRRVEIVLK